VDEVGWTAEITAAVIEAPTASAISTNQTAMPHRTVSRSPKVTTQEFPLITANKALRIVVILWCGGPTGFFPFVSDAGENAEIQELRFCFPSYIKPGGREQIPKGVLS
jgi:hypothetical protein